LQVCQSGRCLWRVRRLLDGLHERAGSSRHTSTVYADNIVSCCRCIYLVYATFVWPEV
jgi:hypothetical protein